MCRQTNKNIHRSAAGRDIKTIGNEMKNDVIEGLITMAEVTDASKAETFLDLERNGKKYWVHVFVKAEEDEEDEE